MRWGRQPASTIRRVKLTVLGANGAWPGPGDAASGFLLEHDGFRLVLDLGYATLPRLLTLIDARDVDAVYVTHGHPDHCADLNPLLRARTMADRSPAPLALYAPPGALDAVLALDRPGWLDNAYELHEFEPGAAFEIGPFRATTRLLPHSRPNAGIRLTADNRALVYTGDRGPGDGVAELALGATVLLAEATYATEVPDDLIGTLSSALDAGREAAAAGVERLLLTHLLPGTDVAAAVAAATSVYDGEAAAATSGLELTI